MGFKEGCVLSFIFVALTIISAVQLQTIQFDGEGCDKINLLAANQECPSVGLFSTPGDCTVFYKCLKENEKITAFIEFCGKGYNFNGSGCIPSTNKTDCPQFHCIASLGLSSDDSNAQVYKVEVNDDNQLSSTKTPDFSTTTEMSWEIIDSEEDISEMSDQNYKNFSSEKNSKKTTPSSFETPGEPFPYKSRAPSYSYSIILQLLGSSLISTVVYIVRG